MKGTTIFLFFFFLLLGCKEKDNPKSVNSLLENHNIELYDNEIYSEEDNDKEASLETEINVEQTDASDFRTDEKGIISRYLGHDKAVAIPAQVSGISVTAIGDFVFWERGLTSVTIPDTVTSIGIAAFSENKLSSIAIPDGVTLIGEVAFSDNRLTAVIIPSGVTFVGSGAFQLNLLASVSLPGGLTSIDRSVFNSNRLTSITIPGSVTSIGDYAFASNYLTSVTIPDSVTSIGKGAFTRNRERSYTSDNMVVYGENLLTSVTIGANVSLGEGDDPSFDNGFDDFYNASGKQAGTYICSDGQWSMVAR
jgi:tRNA G37 N-methylase TrmD